MGHTIITAGNGSEPPSLDDVLAIRCPDHKDIRPYLRADSAQECAICLARAMGEQFAYDLVVSRDADTWHPILDRFAGYLTHHALLRTRLEIALRRLELASPGAGDALRLEWDVLDARPDNAAAVVAAQEVDEEGGQ